jgi:hypothetical protein
MRDAPFAVMSLPVAACVSEEASAAGTGPREQNGSALSEGWPDVFPNIINPFSLSILATGCAIEPRRCLEFLRPFKGFRGSGAGSGAAVRMSRLKITPVQDKRALPTCARVGA